MSNVLLNNLLRISGVALLGLFGLNFFVPRQFRWREEMARLSLVNRRIFQVHAIFIALILLMMGLLLTLLPHALLEPQPLARAVLAGLIAFWGLRLFMQIFFYDAALWRGKRFETAMHVLFSGLWLFFTVTFSVALWNTFHA
jgi:hypothetical protein